MGSALQCPLWLLLVRLPGNCGVGVAKPCQAAAAEVGGAFLADRLFGEDEGQADGFYFQRHVLLREQQRGADEYFVPVASRDTPAVAAQRPSLRSE